MNDVTSLLDQLDTATTEVREQIWAAAVADITPEDVVNALQQERACGPWLVLRHDAGPPGLPLPSVDEAKSRLLQDAGTAADAYAAVFAGPEIDDPDEVIPLLTQGTSAALKENAFSLGGWLAARAALAGLALGVPALAWDLLDLLTDGESRHPEMDKVATFLPIRGHADLEASPWVQALICWLWPRLEVPAIPMLPFPEEHDEPLKDILARLEEVGASQVGKLIEWFLAELDQLREQDRADDPLVQDLERRALAREGPPELEALPSWFMGWARHLERQGRFHVAYLAGQLLYAHHCPERTLVASLVLRLARASDLPILRAGLDDPALNELLIELEKAAERLGHPLGDALVAAALPPHVNHTGGMFAVAHAPGVLAKLTPRPGGGLSVLLGTIRDLGDARQKDMNEARPRAEALWTRIRRAAARLGDPRQLAVADVERAARSLEVSEISLGLLDLVSQGELSALERLLQALVLLSAVDGTTHAPIWRPALRHDASQAIWSLGSIRLFELRIRLLDGLIAEPGQFLSIAELYFQRANSSRALHLSGGNTVGDVTGDLYAAIEHARRDGQLGFLADAMAMLARVEAERLRPDDSEEAGRRLALLDDVLRLPVPAERRATLLAAKAHLLRGSDPGQAASLVGEALTLLRPESPYRAELGAEHVMALVGARQATEAVALGRRLVSEATEGISDSVFAMVHHSLGYALEATGDLHGARGEYLRALDRARGSDWLNEAATRVRLAGLALLTQDAACWNEQRVVLSERRDRLSAEVRLDLDRLIAEAARRGLATHADAEAALTRSAATSNAEDRTIAALQRARLVLESGGTSELGAVLIDARECAHLPEVSGLILELAHNYGDLLEAGLLTDLVDLARRTGRPSAEARLLDHLGRTADACQVLEQAMMTDLGTHERLACAHMLVTMLGDDRRQDRLRWCGTLETLLSEHDAPVARIDLAASYRLLADGDRALLMRAFDHGLQALAGLRVAREQAHGNRVLGLVIADLVHVALGVADPEVIGRARWLLEDRPIPPSELTEMRYAVAHNLLVLGPIALPAAHDVAADLLKLVAGSEHAPPTLPALQARLAWIRDVLANEPVGVPRPSDVARGPADEFPLWLIRMVAGHDDRVRASDIERGIDAVALALHLRFDAADHVLGNLVRLQGALSPGARDRLFTLVHNEVAGPNIGPGAWEELEHALGTLKDANKPRLLSAIEDEIERARDGVPRPPQESRPRYSGSRQYAQEAFDRAVRLMRLVHDEPEGSDAPDRIREARELLADAVDVARRKKMHELSDFEISLGNAWKMPPDEDVERALGIYDQVSRRDLHREQRAKLHKVQGDALRHRGRPDDLRRALDLLLLSAKERSGWLRAESLLNAANVARKHPDLDEDDRIVRAVELYVEAVRADANHVEDQLFGLLPLLGEWAARRPDDERPEALRAELRRRYPQHQAEIDAPVRRPTPRLVEHLVSILKDPAARAYAEVAGKLRTPAQMAQDPFGIKERTRRVTGADLTARRAQENILGDPDRIASLLAELDEHPGVPEAAPGVALARARLLAELCRAGRASIDDVRRASDTARAAASEVADPIARALLTREHAKIWSPDDHADDPVCDFAFAVDLARAAMALEGGEQTAVLDSLEMLARSLRYSPAGDIGQNLAEARRLYALLVERARAEGQTDLAANALLCLADAESQGAEGDRVSRLRAGMARIEEAKRTTRNPYKRAEFTSGLAWQQTQIAILLTGEERVTRLREALATFDEVALQHLEQGHEKSNHRLNRAVCFSTLERLTRGRQAEVAVWRKELTVAQAEGGAHLIATLQHNLANALLTGSELSRAELAEGLALCEKAVAVRSLRVNARHHWETTLLAGSTLARCLMAKLHRQGIELPWSDSLVWDKARSWLSKAVAAARTLGPGEELAHAAGELAMLVRSTRSIRDGLAVADEGWTAIRESAPFLLFHQESARWESMRALDLSLWFAYALAREGPQIVSPGIAFAMEGDRARVVLRWLLRGFAPLRRPVLARLGRPEGVGGDVWADWQTAVATRDPLRVVAALRAVRERSLSFLSHDLDLGGTWRWLRAHPGAIAVTVILAQPISLVVVLSVDGSHRERVQVLGVPTESAPVESEELWRALSNAVDQRSASAEQHDRMWSWAKTRIVRPLLGYLKQAPSAVLWCPGQALRLVAPRALWGNIPVAVSAAPALPDLLAAPGRGRSTLLVLADPAQGALDLGGAGVQVAERLLGAATGRGDASILISVGASHGRGVGGLPGLSGPASATNLIARARDHDVFVVIAHGEAPSPEAAALLLLDERGAICRLDVEGLAGSAGAFTGATVLLLSCESGRIGETFHEPGGVAGALIAAGAKAVIAPLWPVRLDVAEVVAEAVLRGLVSGEEPFEVLARLQVEGREGGPTLGPAPTVASQERAVSLQQLAFVTWVG